MFDGARLVCSCPIEVNLDGYLAWERSLGHEAVLEDNGNDIHPLSQTASAELVSETRASGGLRNPD